MMNKALLAPSVMCVSAWDGMKDLEALKNSGVELLHADVMDGEFVPNLMLGTEAIKQLRRLSPIPLDIHLMIERPEDKLAWFDPQPGEYVSVHVESTKHLQRALSRIRDCGAKPMAALNPATPLCMIEDVLPDVEAALLAMFKQTTSQCLIATVGLAFGKLPSTRLFLVILWVLAMLTVNLFPFLILIDVPLAVYLITIRMSTIFQKQIDRVEKRGQENDDSEGEFPAE